MKKSCVRQKTRQIPGTRLFARASSTAIPPATILVERAHAYIVDHACDGIRASDVIAHLGTSRSLLELRYRQIRGKSLLEDILDTRLADVKQQLSGTDRTILQIGRACGFNNANNLQRLFKKRFGVSMRDYRDMLSYT
jgi:LacI family transcriptional regulator